MGTIYYIRLFSQLFPKKCITHLCMHTPQPKIYDLAETSTFGIFRGQNVRGRNVRAETS